MSIINEHYYLPSPDNCWSCEILKIWHIKKTCEVWWGPTVTFHSSCTTSVYCFGVFFYNMGQKIKRRSSCIIAWRWRSISQMKLEYFSTDAKDFWQWTVHVYWIRCIGPWGRCYHWHHQNSWTINLVSQEDLQTDRTQDDYIYSIMRSQCYKWYISNEADAGELYWFIQSIVSIPDQDKIDKRVALCPGDMQRRLWRTMSGRKFSHIQISDFLWPFGVSSRR